MKGLVNRLGFRARFLLLAMSAMAALAVASAQEGGSYTFDPSAIATSATSTITSIATAGAAVLALSIGVTVAWRYAKKFLKG